MPLLHPLRREPPLQLHGEKPFYAHESTMNPHHREKKIRLYHPKAKEPAPHRGHNPRLELNLHKEPEDTGTPYLDRPLNLPTGAGREQ